VNVSISDLVIAVASTRDAAAMVEVIHAAFGARPPLDPPSTAIDETSESIAELISAGGGIYASVAGRPAGAIVITGVGDCLATFQRVSVHPDFQRHGIASAMVEAALDYAAELGYRRVELFARSEFAELIAFWQHRDFSIDRPEAHGVILARSLPLCVSVPRAEDMRDLGTRLAEVLRAGDVVIATGELGAGKTTLTQGIGRGLGAEGRVISPTFVLARIHPTPQLRPALVHVDAYRLSRADELDDLDLDATLADSVTVVEWGAGIAEGLADDRLEIHIYRDPWPDAADDLRKVLVRPVGARWREVDLQSALLPRVDHG